MIYVPDTNILLRFAVRTDPQHSSVLSAIGKLRNNGDEIHILPQTRVEFWNVFTRPANRNGFGFAIQNANHSLKLIEKIFPLLPDENVHREWRKLVVQFGVSGVSVHDARIVAVDARSSSYKYSDFQRFRFHALFKSRHRRRRSENRLKQETGKKPEKIDNFRK